MSLASRFRDSAEAGVVVQHQVAGVESFGLKGWTVAWDEKPVTNLVAEQFDGTDGRELAAKFWICGISAVGEHQPDTIIPGRFLVIAEHADDAVVEVDGKSGKHTAYFGVQRRDRIEDECVRRGLFSFGGARHDCSKRTITDWSGIRHCGCELPALTFS